MKSKVTNVQGNGHYDGQHGRLYKFEYEFEDGTILEASHKTETPRFRPGDECEYEITGSYNGQHRGKVQKPMDANSAPRIFSAPRPQAKNWDPDRENKIDASWAIGQINLDGMTHDQIVAKALRLIDVRNALVKQLKNNQAAAAQEPEKPVSGNDAKELGMDPTDDLPY